MRSVVQVTFSAPSHCKHVAATWSDQIYLFTTTSNGDQNRVVSTVGDTSTLNPEIDRRLKQPLKGRRTHWYACSLWYEYTGLAIFLE